MQVRAQALTRGALTQPSPVHNRLVRVAPVRAVKLEKETKIQQDEDVEYEGPEVAPTTQEVRNLLTGT